MSVAERDHYTGHMTTGHEWNGIKELNTPVPLVLIVCLAAAALFSLGYWIMMPAFPLGDSYTQGRLGFDQRQVLAEQLAHATRERAVWEQRMTSASFDDIRTDDKLMGIIAEVGPPLYLDNCAVCHGSGGRGASNFPNLADDEWHWDNAPEAIEHTLRVGINADHPQTRVAQMPGFGVNKTLDSRAVRDVAFYLRSLTEPGIVSAARAADVASAYRGGNTFKTLCVACHGVDAKGNRALGAPNLVDDAWLYGNDPPSLFKTIWSGRGGHMPAWENRLSAAERKILALYVLSLSSSSAAN